MLRFLCDERQSATRCTRREWLRVCGPAGVAAMAPAANAVRAARGAARSVLLIFTGGGVSQLDTFDPKPDAPAEIRGEFRTIPTPVSGTRVCEHLPRLARLADRYAILRSV